MKYITTYDPDGRFLVVKTVDDDADPVLIGGPFGTFIDGQHDPATEYVVAGAVVPRPHNSTLLTGTTLYNVPLPAIINIDNVADYPATDSTVELDFRFSGSYHVTVVTFPIQSLAFTVTK